MTRTLFLRLAATLALATLAPALYAQEPSAAAVSARTTPVGFPQDAGPHDTSMIEWWYVNSFLTTESGRKIAVVGSFFRTGLTKEKKGHYFIYSLTDLDTQKTITASILDRANVNLLKAILSLRSMQKPDDPRPMQMLAQLQKDQLPKPHRVTETAVVKTTPRFSIAMAGSTFAQVSDDARSWRFHLTDPKFTLSLDLAQQTGRPPMLVGGEGKTGLNRPDDMYYLSLTRTDVSGELTQGGKTEKVTGSGWIDRQWGSSWIVGNNGWDWFGLQLSDGSDLIVYRVKDNVTGKVLRAEATLLKPDGTQVVDKNVVFTPSGAWIDPVSKITYPATFQVTLGTIGHTLTITPAFAAQTIPVIGIGDAIWEGVVNVTGTDREGKAVVGRGYQELVGYARKGAPATPPL